LKVKYIWKLYKNDVLLPQLILISMPMTDIDIISFGDIFCCFLL